MKLTQQEIFTTVVKHLLTQNKTSIDEKHISCLYRGPNGLKCAVGILITDDEYSEEMECKSVDVLIDENLLPERLIEHSYFLQQLQKIHDSGQPKDWEVRLRMLCKTHKLKWEL